MVKCTNCNKVFDEEKYYGICPKCATYNRPKRNDSIDEMFGFEDAYSDADFTTQQYGEKDHDRMHKQYDGVSSKTLHKNPIPTYEQMKLDIDKNNNRRSKSKTKRTVTISGDSAKKSMMAINLLTIVIFAVIMLVCGLTCVTAKKAATKAEYTLSYETEQVECGEVFDYYGIPISVSHAEVIDTELIKEGLPSGMKMIAIYINRHTEEHVYVSADECVYIKDNDTYRRPINRYELETAFIMLNINSDLILTDTGMLYRDGMFVVLVDEDADEVTLVLDQKKEVNKINVLNKRFEVALPLGE